MRIKQQRKDFQVEERINLPGEQGAYAYYRVEKRGIPTTEARDRMAAKLKVTPSAVAFPALKDAAAITVQYASVRKKGPASFGDQDYHAELVRWGPRALRPTDLERNYFTIVVRDLAPDEAARLAETVREMETQGLPNYFDEQRFGSYSPKGFLGKAVLLRDAELAVRIYLSEPMRGDPPAIREFKELVKTHWGQWGYLLHQAPRPSNFRSVITYLKDHPHNYRKAVNLIQDRLLSIYLAAYQSWIWNNVLKFYLEHHTPITAQIDIADTMFPLPALDTDLTALPVQAIDLLRLTAQYAPPVDEAVDAVLTAEGLTIRDFKARILQRVYLSKGERPIRYVPDEVEVAEPVEDEINQGKLSLTVKFSLEPGRYATLVLKTAAAHCGIPFRIR